LTMKFRVPILALAGALLCAAPALAAEGGEAAGEGSWSALIFYCINAAIFVALIVYYAGPAVRQMFADRARLLRERRAHAQAALEEAERAAREAARLLDQLAAEKQRIVEELEAETTYQVKLIRETAEAGAKRIARDAEITVAATAEDARRRVRAYMAGVAGVVARELIERNFTADDQRALLAGFSDKLASEARS